LVFLETFDQQMQRYADDSPIISSPDSWWSNLNPVNWLVENAALAEAFVAAERFGELQRELEEERKRQEQCGRHGEVCHGGR